MKIKGIAWKNIFCLLILVILGCGGSGGGGGVSTEPPPPKNIGIAQIPFGSTLHNPATISEMAGLGVKWVRISGITGINWGMIETSPGNYNWSSTDNTVTLLKNAGINIYATVLIQNPIYGVTYGYKPGDTTSMNAMKNFLKALAERYDGDGINDAPGSPIIDVLQINNEINLTVSWADTYQHYAEMLIEAYTAIKSVSPNVLVAMAAPSGPPGIPALQQVASYLTGGPYFDILDIHLHSNNGGTYNENINNVQGIFIIDDYINDAKNIINSTNPNAKLWMAETSISNNVPSTQTELKQAVDLTKEYIYYRVKGVDVILWSKFYDAVWNGDSTHYFSNNGLVDLQGIKKLSYYSYQLLLEKLDSSDWNNIQTIQESEDVYIYKFTKNNKPIYVAWWDYFNDSTYTQGKTKQATITNIQGNSVLATEVVPKFSSGKDVTDYSTAFKTETKTVTGGQVTLSLGDSPVFVEEKL
jgi:hypothetical protein